MEHSDRFMLCYHLYIAIYYAGKLKDYALQAKLVKDADARRSTLTTEERARLNSWIATTEGQDQTGEL